MKLDETESEVGKALSAVGNLRVRYDAKGDGCKESVVSGFIPRNAEVVRRKSYKTSSAGGGSSIHAAYEVNAAAKDADAAVKDADVNNNDRYLKRILIKDSYENQVYNSEDNYTIHCQSSNDDKSLYGDHDNFDIELGAIPWDIIKKIVASSDVGSEKNPDKTSSPSCAISAASSSCIEMSPSSLIFSSSSSCSPFEGVVSLVYEVESSKARSELSKCDPEIGLVLL